MSKVLFVLAFVAFAAADVSHLFRPLPKVVPRPVPSGKFIAILRSDADVSPDGSYHYAYETENGISAQEQGNQKALPEGSGTVAQGGYHFVSPEGVPVSVQYVADENGFQPQSDAIPTPPPVPSYILRSLEFNARNPEPSSFPALKKVAPPFRRY
ncbi:endocuticle structural glycoprotein SgAbd-2-like [Rhynchophorus ferrugineus]|uniref:Uncharacterized protein n=1 Tax=Rhynchophorus ferrugineus TaxID=354439 RepID=A0A834M4C6_RHYFE|nr:hypothetical protein GWI33_020395 [Rhynchophorus ferrugineus]